MVSLESAVELREQCVTQPLLDQIELLEREKPTTVATVVGTEKGGISQEIPQKTADPSPGSICCSGTRSSSKDMEWGERGMDDLSMLAKLQKIEVESELLSLHSQLNEMSAKYNTSVQEKEALVKEHILQAQEHAKDEIASMSTRHSVAMSGVKARLAQEKSRCQDLRLRLEHMAQEYHGSIKESEDKHCLTRQELDKAQEELDCAHFNLERETARRKRLQHRHKELEEAGFISPFFLSPKIVRSPEQCSPCIQAESSSPHPSGKPLAHATTVHGECGESCEQVEPLNTVTCGRTVLEEARARLTIEASGEEDNDATVSETHPDCKFAAISSSPVRSVADLGNMPTMTKCNLVIVGEEEGQAGMGSSNDINMAGEETPQRCSSGEASE
ncbi:unnamed protein product [Choristocarpus tenellus]